MRPRSTCTFLLLWKLYRPCKRKRFSNDEQSKENIMLFSSIFQLCAHINTFGLRTSTGVHQQCEACCSVSSLCNHDLKCDVHNRMYNLYSFQSCLIVICSTKTKSFLCFIIIFYSILFKYAFAT